MVSPLLLNIALHGMEQAAGSVVTRSHSVAQQCGCGMIGWTVATLVPIAQGGSSREASREGPIRGLLHGDNPDRSQHNA